MSDSPQDIHARGRDGGVMNRPDQLRRWADAREKRGLSAVLLRDSADEIERLRARVRSDQREAEAQHDVRVTASDDLASSRGGVRVTAWQISKDDRLREAETRIVTRIAELEAKLAPVFDKREEKSPAWDDLARELGKNTPRTIDFYFADTGEPVIEIRFEYSHRHFRVFTADVIEVNE